jgi:hypothetical protein
LKSLKKPDEFVAPHLRFPQNCHTVVTELAIVPGITYQNVSCSKLQIKYLSPGTEEAVNLILCCKMVLSVLPQDFFHTVGASECSALSGDKEYFSILCRTAIQEECRY